MNVEYGTHRPLEEVQAELAENASKYRAAPPGSFKSMKDDLGAFLHFISGGRFGHPSLLSNLTSSFVEANEILRVNMRSELAKRAETLKKLPPSTP